MRPLDFAIAMLVITIWGLNFVVVKVGLLEIQPFLFMTMRFVVVAVILVPFVKFPKGMLLQIFAYSVVLGMLHFSLMFNAVHLLDASTASLLSQLNTPFAVILAALLFKDYPRWRRLLGIIIAFAGCVVIAGEPRLDGALMPIMMVVGGTFLWAVGAIQVKHMGSIDPFVLNGWMALMAAPQLLLISLMTETGQWDNLVNLSLIGWGTILYQSVLVVIVGYGLWYSLVKRYPISKVVPLTLLLPAIGVLGGVVLLDEPLTTTMLIGGALIIVGVGIVVMREAARGESPRTKGL